MVRGRKKSMNTKLTVRRNFKENNKWRTNLMIFDLQNLFIQKIHKKNTFVENNSGFCQFRRKVFIFGHFIRKSKLKKQP